MGGDELTDLLNDLNPLVDALLLLTRDLAPLVDESPDKGRIAIGVLEITADYAQRLERRLTIAGERRRGLFCCPPPAADEEEDR
jgi:hypothetical protein